MGTETTKQGIRVRTLFDELISAGFSRGAIHAAVAGVVGELVPPQAEGSAPSAPGLTLPQDGDGWLLTDAEADEVRRRVDAGGITTDARIDQATETLRALLRLPEERPGAWEAGHVEALEDELRAVLALLDGR